MSKKTNKDLIAEQKLILSKDSFEILGTSDLNIDRKKKVFMLLTNH
jgi:hypothetical protein|tara:strand:+ start:643 stop:780 length:138 start_codon:yes stop_codon:yes gene_type:complete